MCNVNRTIQPPMHRSFLIIPQDLTPLPGGLCSGGAGEPKDPAHPPGTHPLPTLPPVLTLAALRAPQQQQHQLKCCTETLRDFTCTHLTAGGELWAWWMLALLICSSWKHSERWKGSAKSTLTDRQWCPWCCIILLPTQRYIKTQLTIRFFWITALWTWFMEELCGMVHPRAPCWV